MSDETQGTILLTLLGVAAFLIIVPALWALVMLFYMAWRTLLSDLGIWDY